ncbi:hypothetical protein NPIL_409421 [Nephila pilipes]|uniref:Uncharacterized protein n=1 Tax=Nephila pilipes TaxID=299642 RepID=A0A8X6TFV5_NEPPI|nr:hypothetical protein NPIL_409421 [Nephila pilipes]
MEFIPFMKNRALQSGINITSYEAMFGRASRVKLSTIPIPREVFDAAEDEQQFENALIALNACSELENDAIIVKKASE